MNSERIRLMARIAILRKQEGRGSFEIYRDRLFDYLFKKIVKAAVIYTLGAAAAAVGVLLWAFSRPQALNTTHLQFYGGVGAFSWLAGLILVCLIAGAVEKVRYVKAQEDVHKYHRMYNRLKWLNDKEESRQQQASGQGAEETA